MNRTPSIAQLVQFASAACGFAPLPAGEQGMGHPITRLCFSRGSIFSQRIVDCFYGMSHRVSLPLAIWGSNGWIGLFAHWQTISGLTWLLEETIRKTRAPFQTFRAYEEIFKGDASCAVVKSEAH